jgi:hypothetical protein
MIQVSSSTLAGKAYACLRAPEGAIFFENFLWTDEHDLYEIRVQGGPTIYVPPHSKIIVIMTTN